MVDTNPNPTIRPAQAADGADLARIYNHYVLNTTVTFEEEPIAGAAMAERLAETRATGLPFLIAEANGVIVGFAYASKWKGRCAYRFSAEVTIYLDCDFGGRGIGSALYDQLLPALRAQGLHAAIAGIALPNDASIRLHEKYGFVPIGTFREVGRKFERWIDVGYWQRVFDS